jgi:drug/metabolite transporter (DMT)-like permease
MSRRGWLLFLVMGFIWGVPYLLIKVAVGTLTPASLVFLRTAIGMLVLLPIAAYRGQLRPLLPRWRPLLAYTAIELAIPWLLLSDAERKLSSSLSGLLLAAVPLVSAIIAWLTGGERLGPRRILGLGVGLAGVAALVGLDASGGNVPAIVQIVIVAICYAAGPMVLARYLRDAPGLGVVAGSLVLTAVGYLPVALVQLPRHWPPLRVTGSVVGLAVLCTAIAFVVFFALIREVGPVRASVITYVNPAVAVALGVTLLGERFTVGIGVGFALILLGSVLATRRGPAAPEPVVAEPVVAGPAAGCLSVPEPVAEP